MYKKIILHAWRLIYPLLIYLAVALSVQAIFSYVLASGMVGPEYKGLTETEYKNILLEKLNEKALLLTAVYNGILIPIYIFFVKRDEKRRIRMGGVRYRLPGKLEYPLILVLGMSAAIAINILVSLSGLALLSEKYQQVAQAIYSDSVFMQILSAAIIAPVLEELFFRGLIFKRLREYCKPWVAILISSLFFGAFHGNLVQFVYASIVGAMLAYTYEKYKTIYAPILFHIGANMLSVIITNLIGNEQVLVIAMAIATPISIALTIILLKHVKAYQVKVVEEPIDYSIEQ